jgi:hypothetical protein
LAAEVAKRRSEHDKAVAKIEQNKKELLSAKWANDRSRADVERRMEELQEKQRKLNKDEGERKRRERQARQELEKRRAEVQKEEERVRKALSTSGAPPAHWMRAREAASPLQVVHVNDREVLSALQECLTGTGIGDGGRDQKERGTYSRLVVSNAWRVENPALLASYRAAQERVRQVCSAGAVNFPMHKVKVRSELYASARKLPWEMRRDCNEVRLLHGTSPHVVLRILHSGMNERFSGGLFGHGVYFADDCGKIDQYVTRDERHDASSALHQMLYRKAKHEGNVFYALVCCLVHSWNVVCAQIRTDVCAATLRGCSSQ